MKNQKGDLHMLYDSSSSDAKKFAPNEHTSSVEDMINRFSLEDRIKFEFNYIFSKRIKERRKNLGWTQDELAKRSGVNRVTIAKIEMQQRTVSVEVMLKLLYALGLGIQFVDLTDLD